MRDMIKAILEFPQTFLKISWQHLETSEIKLAVSTLVFPTLCLIVLSTITVQVFSVNANVESVVKNIQAFGVYTEVLGKFLVYRFNRNKLSDLLANTRTFWRTEKCNEKNVKSDLNNILAKTLIAQRLFSFASIACVFLILISPIFTNRLPLGTWCMDDSNNLFLFALIVQEITLSMVAVYVVAYDGIYLGFCMNLILQFKILNNLLENLSMLVSPDGCNKTVYLENLKSYLEQHKNLLLFSKELKRFCSPILLIEYTTVALILCAEMYAFFDSMDIGNALSHFFNVIILTTQLAFYCIPIDYIGYEAGLISNSIYCTDWYSRYVTTLRNTLPIAMQQSQKEIIFKAGGLIDINSRAVLTVFKVGWSICMLMRGLKK